MKTIAPTDLHLGTRHHLWGGESHFSLSSGTLGEATAQAFADYLKGKGWNATVAKGNEAAGADITITGRLIDVGVDAMSGIGQTTLNAKSRMVVQVKNHADGSQVRETLTSTGANQVFWFDPEDAQELLNESVQQEFREVRDRHQTRRQDSQAPVTEFSIPAWRTL